MMLLFELPAAQCESSACSIEEAGESRPPPTPRPEIWTARPLLQGVSFVARPFCSVRVGSLPGAEIFIVSPSACQKRRLCRDSGLSPDEDPLYLRSDRFPQIQSGRRHCTS